MGAPQAFLNRVEKRKPSNSPAGNWLTFMQDLKCSCWSVFTVEFSRYHTMLGSKNDWCFGVTCCFLLWDWNELWPQGRKQIPLKHWYFFNTSALCNTQNSLQWFFYALSIINLFINKALNGLFCLRENIVNVWCYEHSL